MPHIMVSYAKPVLNETSSGELLKHLHKLASGFETVSAEALKLRACSFDQAWSGAGFGSHVHVSMSLLSGRPAELKESMASSLQKETVSFLQNHSVKDVSVTTEVRELEVYVK